ncbi:hypothetical protein [Flavobacterium sp. ENC]|uniref:hypothetical protein n=1 Tax=Flavobacterium sp. ENC TaxID=2897330 RepID=UPI001E4BD3A4|nr:hypothetical protein [Flavobacterium sp. ENC]MCD0465181.1 hypothetical protein [Flavobacterium sp. ENC]
MENVNNYTSEELQKCPYHAQMASQAVNNTPDEQPNTGDWEDERDEDGTDPNRYEEEGNNNSGGAGSTGSAATNS